MNYETLKTENNYTNYIDELTNDLTEKIDENTKKIIKNNIKKINWDEQFNKTCGYIVSNGNSCVTIAKPGYKYCRRHLKKSIKELNENNHIADINELTKNLDENNKKIIENNIKKINWDRHFNRTCGQLLKNGNNCITLVKPGHNHCQKHLNTKINKDNIT